MVSCVWELPALLPREYGNDDQPKANTTLYRALLIAIISALALLLLASPIAMLSFYLIDGSAEVETYAQSYFFIRIWAAPATLLLFVVHGWFLGMQNARFPLYLSLTVNSLNIVFSVFFVQVLGWNADGVAMGTVCAQYFGLLMAGLMLLYRYRPYLTALRIGDILQQEAMKQFLSLNRDIFIRTLCLVYAFAFFTARAAAYGDDILAAFSILLQLWYVLAHFIDGFAFAAESLVGKYIGARDEANLKLVIDRSFRWSLGFGFLISICYFLFPREILSLFTDKQDLIDLALLYIGWTIAAPLINGFCFIWDGIFIGAADGRSLRNSLLICLFAIFLPIFYVTEGVLQEHSLWLAMTMMMIFRGLILYLYAKKRTFI